MKRNEVEEADIVISSHGYDDLGMLLKISIALKPFLVTMRYVRFELSDHAFPLTPDDSIDLADVQITLVQTLYNYGLLSPKLVLGSVPEGHYFHSADHVVLYYP